MTSHRGSSPSCAVCHGADDILICDERDRWVHLSPGICNPYNSRLTPECRWIAVHSARYPRRHKRLLFTIAMLWLGVAASIVVQAVAWTFGRRR